ncbi:hypothetical protein OGAPHI_005811 [Ogataea philodendri]|uniref:Uncharacterized protein n=1 Tax=Ogataea philodendri TaxID=1378263 RepID=A0A9P8NZY7_9ASCO|nr:uncharacterized protein OGAPHI_005811 [Ogataea philodendri]KAH3662559.1 hypothetical protein OGAPHI_005811 [Ogataea philodendri]
MPRMSVIQSSQLLANVQTSPHLRSSRMFCRLISLNSSRSASLSDTRCVSSTVGGNAAKYSAVPALVKISNPVNGATTINPSDESVFMRLELLRIASSSFLVDPAHHPLASSSGLRKKYSRFRKTRLRNKIEWRYPNEPAECSEICVTRLAGSYFRLLGRLASKLFKSRDNWKYVESSVHGSLDSALAPPSPAHLAILAQISNARIVKQQAVRFSGPGISPSLSTHLCNSW